MSARRRLWSDGANAQDDLSLRWAHSHIVGFVMRRLIFEEINQPNATNRWAATWPNQQSDCAPSEDSDQPGHPPSPIRVFAVRSVGSKGPKLSSWGQQRLIRLGWCPGWSESSLGAQSLWWFCHVAAQIETSGQTARREYYPFTLTGLFYPSTFLIKGSLFYFLFWPGTEIVVLKKANRVDPDLIWIYTVSNVD